MQIQSREAAFTFKNSGDCSPDISGLDDSSPFRNIVTESSSSTYRNMIVMKSSANGSIHQISPRRVHYQTLNRHSSPKRTTGGQHRSDVSSHLTGAACHQGLLDTQETNRLLHHLLVTVRQIGEELHQRNRMTSLDQSYKAEWRQVARVIDRTLLIVIFVVTGCTSVAIFARVM